MKTVTLNSNIIADESTNKNEVYMNEMNKAFEENCKTTNQKKRINNYKEVIHTMT
jgi:hypothetical protein